MNGNSHKLIKPWFPTASMFVWQGRQDLNPQPAVLETREVLFTLSCLVPSGIVKSADMGFYRILS